MRETRRERASMGKRRRADRLDERTARRGAMCVCRKSRRVAERAVAASRLHCWAAAARYGAGQCDCERNSSGVECATSLCEW